MRTFAYASLGLALSASLVAQQAEPFGASAQELAMQRFRQDHGDWIVQIHPATGTPQTIYGTGIALDDWRENTLAEARRHAGAVLSEYRELLGLGDSDFVESIGARMGRTWSFKFDQWYRGVPVVHGRADVRINMRGVVAMLGSQAWPIPADFDVRPTIDEQVATAAAWQALEQLPTGASQPAREVPPRLVIWGDIDASQLTPCFLAWEVAVSNVDHNGQGPIGRYYIDARTGAALHYQNDKHECGLPGCVGAASGHAPIAAKASEIVAPPVPTTVTVMAWTRTGADAYSALVNVPLPGVQVSVLGSGTFVTDANGQFVVDLTATTTALITSLDGRHHGVISGPSAPAMSIYVTPGVATTLQLLTSGATTAQAAHTTTSWWVDAVNEYSRSILGNSTQLNVADAVLPSVNIASTCNAYYSGNTINFYQAGGSCSNTAFSTVIVHEWGHGIDDRYGGISNNSGDGLSEGWGDIFGLYIVDSPILGSGFSSPGVGLRNGNNTKMYGTQSEVHAAGEIWMGFAWRYRENLRTNYGTQLARQISEDTVIGSIVADAKNQANAVIEVFVADDDDGNLFNGVPHYQELSAAAIAKGMPYPQIQIVGIVHTPLGNTAETRVPREVSAQIIEVSGTVTARRVVFTPSGGTPTTRNMHPTGIGDEYVAMLPGLTSGSMSYHLEIAHSSGTVLRRPEAGEYVYNFVGATPGVFFAEGFEGAAAGWTHGSTGGTDEWQLGSPSGKSGTTLGVAWSDPSGAAVGARCYGVDLGNGSSNGRYVGNTNSYLRSPNISCAGRSGVRLRFRRWLSVQAGQFDQAQIRVNGLVVWQNDPSSNTQDLSWQQIDLAIPTADNNPSVQLEWRLITDGSLHLGGWHVDQVELVDSGATDTETLTFLPEQSVQGTPLTLTLTTPGGSRPFLLLLGDAVGPTLIPGSGLPTLFVGGNTTVLTGSTDASGNATFNVLTPNVPTANCVRLYSHVLTLNSSFTQFVTTNRHANLFTQTP